MLHHHLLRDLPEVLAHSERVAARVDPAFAQVALLHDVLEDTDTTADELEALVGSEVTASVVLLTRLDSETYAAYIDRLVASGDAAALAVKWADLHDHLALVATLRPSLERRYRRALDAFAGRI
jgi:(p)ppGpp synthase/HD superfamily hydrolase